MSEGSDGGVNIDSEEVGGESVGGVRRGGVVKEIDGGVNVKSEEIIGGVNSGGSLDDVVVTTGREAGEGVIVGATSVDTTRPIMLFNPFTRMIEQTADFSKRWFNVAEM